MLIPITEDKYTDDLKAFFLTVASIAPTDFMGISRRVEFEAKQHTILTKDTLNEIFKSYSGNLTKPENLTRTFLASTHHIQAFDIKNPSREWGWIAKLCHLLIYFVEHDLPQRIKETTTEARKWIDPANYHHSIWQHCYQELQSDTLKQTYANFESYRQQLERQGNPNLDAFLKIYRTVDFAFNEKNKITRNITSRKKRSKSKLDEPKTDYKMIDAIDEDSDELVSATVFEETESYSDVNHERLDNPVPDFTYIKQSTVTNTEKYSSNQIYRRTRAKFAHANKNERFISSNIRQLPIFAVQNICAKLWQWFDDTDTEKDRDEKRVIAYLLLTLYTGYSVTLLAQDINENNKRIIDISSKYSKFEFIVHLDITPLRIKTKGVQSVLANRLTHFQLSIPIPLGTFLTYKGYPDNEQINVVIAKLKKELALPLLSLSRIENSLYNIITHEVSTTQIASIITSRNNKKRADLWYCSHPIKDIQQVYSKAINILTERCYNRECAFQYLDEVILTNESIGSQNSPDYPIVSLFIELLRKKVNSTTDLIEKFNAYNLWLWHISLLLTSIRAVEGAPGFLNQFNLNAGLGWISDKEERATSNSQRLIPICSFLASAIKDFVTYLEQFATKFRYLEPLIHYEVLDILNSKRPLLNYIDSKNEFQSLRPSIVAKEISDHFRFKVDWTRHVGQRFLHDQEVAESLVLAIFGHEPMGQEAWRKQSSLSIGDILATQDIYQKLANKLQLKQVAL